MLHPYTVTFLGAPLQSIVTTIHESLSARVVNQESKFDGRTTSTGYRVELPSPHMFHPSGYFYDPPQHPHSSQISSQANVLVYRGKKPALFHPKIKPFCFRKKKSSLLTSSSSSLSKTMTFIVLQTELLEVWDCLKENQNPDFGMGFSCSFVKKHMLAFFFKQNLSKFIN